MRGIAGKLTVCLIVTTVGVLIILGGMEYHAGQLAIDRELRHSLKTIANRLTISLRQSVYEFDTGTARDTVLGEFPNPDVAAILVWTQDRQRLLCGFERYNNEIQDILKEPLGNQLVSERRDIFIKSGIPPKSEIIGEVQIFLDRSFPEERLRWLLFQDLGKITLTVVLLLAILVFIINQFLVSPLETIRYNMQETERAVLESSDSEALDSLPLPMSAKELSHGFSELRNMSDIYQKMVMSIKDREKALCENEEKYHSLINNIPSVTWITDKEGKTSFMSPNIKEIYGYAPEEIYEAGESLWFGRIHPEDIEKLKGAYNNLFEKEGHFDIEYRIKRKDGEWIWLHDKAMTTYEEGGRRFAYGVFSDITENKEAEVELERYRMHLEDLVKERTAELEKKTEELKKSEKSLMSLLKDVNKTKADLEKANEKLKELDRLKSMFIASMSHELRTPLNSIIGFTGIILQGLSGGINEQQKDQLRRVYASAKHLLNLISDVIDISKIEAGKVEAYAEEFQLIKIIEEAVSNLKTQIDDKGLDLEISISPGIYMNTDKKRLLQCILNFLSNAVKFTEKGGISIASAENNDMIEIKVKDTGIGIKEEDIPRLFNSFVRLDSDLRATILGTGLGLYLTKKIAAEILGGSVAVVSKQGEGSIFSLKIPRELWKKYSL